VVFICGGPDQHKGRQRGAAQLSISVEVRAIAHADIALIDLREIAVANARRPKPVNETDEEREEWNELDERDRSAPLEFFPPEVNNVTGDRTRQQVEHQCKDYSINNTECSGAGPVLPGQKTIGSEAEKDRNRRHHDPMDD
jgi:hypothetical protein